MNASLYEIFRSRGADSYYSHRYKTIVAIRHALSTEATRRRIVDRFNRKNVIFTITAGRTGSDTLSRLLANFADTISLHEPQPQYRYILEDCQANQDLAARFFLFIKAPSIIALRKGNVVETSHLFSKGFFEPIVAFGFRPSLIMLSRDARGNAMSLLNKQAVPGRSLAGRGYLISPLDPVYVSIAAPETLSDYQLCYWYCIEMEHRQKIYSEACQQLGLNYCSLKTAGLNNVDEIFGLADTLGLVSAPQTRPALEDQVGHVFNQIGKGNRPLVECPDEQEAEVRSRLVRLGTVDDVFERIGRFQKS